MNRYKDQFDVFVCGGSQHVPLLQLLLRTLQPYGTIHLASSFFTTEELRQLQGLYDVLHEPKHSDDGYANFELFSIRDINRLARAPHFIKLDADVHLEPDWIRYVEEALEAHPDAVLFGPRRGNVAINFEISGIPVRQRLNRDLIVRDGCKVIGGFYVGQTAFFKTHQTFMRILHEFLWYPNGAIKVVGQGPNFRGNEDTLRSLVVHAAGAGDRLHVVDSKGRIKIFRPNIVGSA